MAGIAPSLDAVSVASLSDAEIDAYVRRLTEILARHQAPEVLDAFVARIEELCDRANAVKSK
jgi:hypothetical protein